jgi:DNA-binding GntR family transcriptional regulator
MRTTVSKYEALAAELREQIKSGELRPGDRLPSIAQLREQYKVSYGTVQCAMLVLKVERLVEGRQGIGVFVCTTCRVGRQWRGLTSSALHESSGP